MSRHEVVRAYWIFVVGVALIAAGTLAKCQTDSVPMVTLAAVLADTAFDNCDTANRPEEN